MIPQKAIHSSRGLKMHIAGPWPVSPEETLRCAMEADEVDEMLACG